MNKRSTTTGTITATAVAAPIIVAAIIAAFDPQAHQAAAALLLATVVVLIASTGRRAATVIAAVTATLSYDYFLTQPYHSFTINETNDLLAVGALLLLGAITVGLRLRSDRHRGDAEEGRNDIARIHAVAELVAEGREPAHIVEIVRIELIDLLALRDCSFDRQPLEGDGAVIERSGNVTIGALSWGVHHHGFPGPSVELPVAALGVHVGRFVLTPSPGVPVSFDKRIVAVALADQVGAAFALSLA